MKPRLKRIPRDGLRITERYADAGDAIEVFPIVRREKTPKSYYAVVERVKRNHWGRISYEIKKIEGLKKTLVLTEELTPLGHNGCRRL